MRLRHQLAALIFAATTTLTAFSQEIAIINPEPVATEATPVAEATSTVTIVTLPEALPAEPPKKVLPSFLTKKQIELLEQAYLIGKSDNHKHPELLQGILMQETKAGTAEYKSAKNNCFGIFQIKIGAAQEVLKTFPELVLQYGVSPTNSTKLRQRLIHDDEFNTSVASKYLLIMKRYGYVTIKGMALAYNQGAGGAKSKNPDTFHYTVGVMKHIRSLN